MSALNSFENWVPTNVIWRAGQPRLRWALLGKLAYMEPFFDMEIGRGLAQAQCHVEQRESSLDELAQAFDRPEAVPSGFIFHLSRCGSTLVSQMLAALDGATVISEAPPVDAILRAHLSGPRICDEQRILWLRALLGALRASGAGQQHFFVKFDAWNALELPLIRQAFPEVPWIFVCREPLEVLRSHARQPGGHMVQGVLATETYGAPPPPPDLPAADYRAWVLTRICEAAHSALDQCGGGRVVNYSTLPAAVCESLLDFFSIPPTAGNLQRLQDASRLDAKQPGTPFIRTNMSPAPLATPAYAQLLSYSFQRLLAHP